MKHRRGMNERKSGKIYVFYCSINTWYIFLLEKKFNISSQLDGNNFQWNFSAFFLCFRFSIFHFPFLTTNNPKMIQEKITETSAILIKILNFLKSQKKEQKLHHWNENRKNSVFFVYFTVRELIGVCCRIYQKQKLKLLVVFVNYASL